MSTSPIITIGGIQFNLAVILMVIVTSLITFLFVRSGTKKASPTRLSGMQNFMEWVVEFVMDFAGSTLGAEKARKFLILALTLIIYIFIGNMLELPFMVVTDVHKPIAWLGITAQNLQEAQNHVVHLLWWKSPTADPAVAISLALIVIILVHFLGITTNTKNYFKHYFQPFFFFLPFNIIEQISNFLTLGLRLFGNIFAGEIMIEVILMMGVWGTIPLVLWIGFSTFIGAIQAFIFAVLSMVYIQMATQREEH